MSLQNSRSRLYTPPLSFASMVVHQPEPGDVHGLLERFRIAVPLDLGEDYRTLPHPVRPPLRVLRLAVRVLLLLVLLGVRHIRRVRVSKVAPRHGLDDLLRGLFVRRLRRSLAGRLLSHRRTRLWGVARVQSHQSFIQDLDLLLTELKHAARGRNEDRQARTRLVLAQRAHRHWAGQGVRNGHRTARPLLKRLQLVAQRCAVACERPSHRLRVHARLRMSNCHERPAHWLDPAIL
eukprot:1177821-Rhodomonas_salina.1